MEKVICTIGLVGTVGMVLMYLDIQYNNSRFTKKLVDLLF